MLKWREYYQKKLLCRNSRWGSPISYHFSKSTIIANITCFEEQDSTLSQKVILCLCVGMDELKCLLPGNTMQGTPGNLLSGPSCHNGTPANACPITLARRASKAFVAISDEVIPPYVNDIIKQYFQKLISFTTCGLELFVSQLEQQRLYTLFLLQRNM